MKKTKHLIDICKFSMANKKGFMLGKDNAYQLGREKFLINYSLLFDERTADLIYSDPKDKVRTLSLIILSGDL